MAYRLKGKEGELDELSDLSEADRRELDDAVLDLLGIETKKQREKMTGDLYDYLCEYFEWVRRKEEKAILNKKKIKRKSVATLYFFI